MIKLLKYLKPYAHIVCLCVILIFAQAMCDLKLPDYMSDIVDTGLANSGVEDTIPVVMSVETFDKITDDDFMAGVQGDAALTQDQKQAIKDSYSKTAVSSLSDKDKKKLKLRADIDVGSDIYIKKDALVKNAAIDADLLRAAIEKSFLYSVAETSAPSVVTAMLDAAVVAHARGEALPDAKNAEMNARIAGIVDNLFMSMQGLPALAGEFESEIAADGAAVRAVLSQEKYAKIAAIFGEIYDNVINNMSIPAIYSEIYLNQFASNIALAQAVAETERAGVDLHDLSNAYIWSRGIYML
ncbi:MAG: hypothetical protein LBQ40_00590, partial [Clostridiales bacterium]|nr:hypothetical protein [Clostridiales bacterium]